MDKFQIETSQNVGISQNVASISDRMFAFAIDTALIIAYIILSIWLLTSMGLNGMQSWSMYLLANLPVICYYLLCETFMNGRTVGKVLLKLRVVKLDGSSATFSNYFIRWLLRIVDVILTSCGGAVFSILLSHNGQRIGDRAAGTTVISEKMRVSLRHTIHKEIASDYIPTYPQVTVLTDKDVREIKNIYDQARRNGNHNVIVALSDKVQKVLEVTPEEKPLDFITKVLEDYNYFTQNM